MRTELSIKVYSEVMRAVDHYNHLPNHFTQLDSRQFDSLEAFWSKLFGEDKSKRWERVNGAYPNWITPNVHIVKQSWSNTACGWGGMGGASCTDSYTVVVENLDAGIIAVYYNGDLAYMAELDGRMQEHRKDGYRTLPGLTRCEESLTVIYKKVPWDTKTK